MTERVAAIVGSGTIPFTRGILPALQRGNESIGEGVRTGIQVMVGNPEDLVAVDAFAASGITVGTSVVEAVGPNTNPLPRCRAIELQNTGSNPILISHRSSFTDDDAFQLPAAAAGISRRVEIPILHNVSVYARAVGGSSTLRMLIV